eukprot:SAG22_NODE_10609_length_525_cov_1.150235_1_plen_147_part_10
MPLLLAALAAGSAAAAPPNGAWVGLHNPSTDTKLEGCAAKEGGPCAIHANVTFFSKTVSPDDSSLARRRAASDCQCHARGESVRQALALARCSASNAHPSPLTHALQDMPWWASNASTTGDAVCAHLQRGKCQHVVQPDGSCHHNHC